jgi:hypothetical protein
MSQDKVKKYKVSNPSVRSSVSKMSGYRMDECDPTPSSTGKRFSLCHLNQPGSAVYPVSYPMDYEASLMGVGGWLVKTARA